MNPEQNAAARALLAFYVEAGVHTLVGDAPVDRMAEPAVAPDLPPAVIETPPADLPSVETPQAPNRYPTLGSKGAAATPPPAPAAVVLAPEAAVMAAREAASRAATLDELRTIVNAFEGCALKSMAKQMVFADGNPAAKLMFVGEAPGREEDIEGLPFVGRSGKLLDLMLAAIGLDRNAAYIANIIPWRPPGNRTPTPQESQICLPFIKRQIELADPDVLVCLGGPSMQTLLNVKDGIMRTRGKWFAYQTGKREIRAIATLHPAYLLRQPLAKRLAWRDFLAIKRALDTPLA
jgi:uracil-DNA glycosylase family 4